MYTLITPSNRYASRLPHLRDCVVYKLVTPRLAPARLGQYLLDLGPGGGGRAPEPEPYEHFLFGLEGSTALHLGDGEERALTAGGFAYLPPGATFALDGGPAQLLWIKRRYEPWAGLEAPGLVSGHRGDEPFADTPVPGFRRRELLPPGDPAFDFNMSLLAFDAGVGLDNIEVHDEEHGLYMTAGAGLYFLDGELLEVEAGDFVYMAPYCPQGFTATGREPAEYLLYKDVYRDGF